MNLSDFVNQSVTFIETQVRSRGFDRVVLGLSGGIDSAVVACLASKALGHSSVSAFLMPSKRSQKHHLDDAIQLVDILKLDSHIISLAPFQQCFETHIDSMNPVESVQIGKSDERRKLRMGNFCARMRMALLYDFASTSNALVLGTSNKSELLLGYGTIFGDLACAINPIGGIYKTQIFEVARILNIPQHIIDKKPSADLFENQSDENDLGYTYQEIDPLLQAIENLGEHLEITSLNDQLVRSGFNQTMVESITKRVKVNAFKRSMPLVFQFQAFSRTNLAKQIKEN